MRKKEAFLMVLMLFGSLFLLSFAKSGVEHEPDIFSEEEYPEDLDTLEEFIQSYYLLLDSDTYLKSYKFIDPAKNVLENDQGALEPFYMKLLQLRNGLRDQVTIFQIGDSHMQSGYFSGTARSALQKYFGNAGRGLIFPYRLSGTNQPDDYQISSKNSFRRIDNPRSLSGYTLANQAESELKIKTNSFFKIECTFDQAKLYANKDARMVLENQVNTISLDRSELEGYSIHHLLFQGLENSADIHLPQDMSELYGISLERDEAGLLYHSMGVNGAGFYTLVDQDMMFEQIPLLKPDLILISLGTNDAQGKFRAEVFRKNLLSFMTRLEESNLDTPILFTLPPDSRKAGKTNRDIVNVADIIRAYAEEHGHAFWDLYEVMGGAGSIVKWRSNSMAAKDHLHFTPKGYMLQGHLFYQALIKGYKTFSETRNN
ncbi:MAG: GDSL-type esterase/lipase family protein [Candidatus Cloacimonetes bacterium]|nr:GDSL-type esterase/lipase family protein [Candidatus Cloacimonadota bacterium]MDD2507270.1 GDSL-type esterase/lipase family protein [Candidatus Cloacimonadota bacterium]MDD4148309.1 GDSL-type esterase/lipase family protein [Candidatus Cloacimonadota bacterium]MDD4560685.1 GDSL-type esterase/lipase family protein [Candidatus Cloacimonadota bacterium]